MTTDTVKLSSSPLFKTRVDPITLKEFGQYYELIRMQLSNVDELNLEANPIWLIIEYRLAEDDFYDIKRVTLIDGRSWPNYNPYFSVSDEKGNYPILTFRKQPKRFKSLDTVRKEFLAVADVSCIQIHEYFD